MLFMTAFVVVFFLSGTMAFSQPNWDLNVKTDKIYYEPGEQINIFLEAEGDKTLTFSSNCQSNYDIYDSEGEKITPDIPVICAQVITEVDLPHTWDYQHSIDEEGKYTIKGSVSGKQAEKEIIVQEEEPSILKIYWLRFLGFLGLR